MRVSEPLTYPTTENRDLSGLKQDAPLGYGEREADVVEAT